MSLVVTLAAMFGKPVAERLAKGLLERKNGAQKFEQATAAMAQGLTAIDALKNTFGKEFFLALNDAIGLSGNTSFTYEASTQAYIKLEDENIDPVKLLRDEFNINLDRLSVMDVKKSNVRNQFLGMLSVWERRCLNYFGQERHREIEVACDSIRVLINGEEGSRRKIKRLVLWVVLGGIGVFMIAKGFFAAVGYKVGVFDKARLILWGIPWLQVGPMVIFGLLLVIFSILSKKQDEEVTLAISIAYDLLEKLGSVKIQLEEA